MSKVGLYIHFPFCARKCRYCDFASYDNLQYLMPKYLEALKNEIKRWEDLTDRVSVQTIFMGGGTPTLYEYRHLIDVLETCERYWNVDRDAEISIEANPETLNLVGLMGIRKAGFNRISIGMQAWQQHHLKYLGRIHSNRDIVQVVEWCREAGFDNVNLDIMFGLPNQTIEEWQETLEKVVNLGVDHISAYSLKVEEGTPFYTMLNRGQLNLPSEDTERQMYHMAIKYLKSQGYIHYELSNFSKAGKQCRHNLIYWNNNEYIGLGSGAHSYWRGKRFANIADPRDYIEKIQKNESPLQFIEAIDRRDEIFETIMLGLRLTEGINKDRFFMRFGKKIEDLYEDVIFRLKREGLLIEDKEAIRLTERGMDLQNVVLLHFME